MSSSNFSANARHPVTLPPRLLYCLNPAVAPSQAQIADIKYLAVRCDNRQLPVRVLKAAPALPKASLSLCNLGSPLEHGSGPPMRVPSSNMDLDLNGSLTEIQGTFDEIELSFFFQEREEVD